MIVFILAALADIVSTYFVGKRGGIEGNPLFRLVPANLRWVFQLVAYIVALSVLEGSPLWLWLVCAALPTFGAVNNMMQWKRAK